MNGSKTFGAISEMFDKAGALGGGNRAPLFTPGAGNYTGGQSAGGSPGGFMPTRNRQPQAPQQEDGGGDGFLDWLKKLLASKGDSGVGGGPSGGYGAGGGAGAATEEMSPW